MTQSMTRDELRRQRAEAEQLLAEAQDKAEAVKQADSDLRARERQLRADAHAAYRDEIRTTGGWSAERNEQAEAFDRAVQSGDGAEAVSAWIGWRYAKTREAHQREIIGQVEDAERRKANPHVTALPGGYPDPPDFAADLNRAVARFEAQHKQRVADEIRAYVAAYVDERLSTEG
jgi:hypothetical protein